MSDIPYTLNPLTGQPYPVQVVMPDVSRRDPIGSGVVTRILGHGGMATVYEIWVPNLEVYRAVKIIKPESTKDAVERFQTEIKILAKLNHSNIIDIHSVGEWKGLPYIEMEKIDGLPLDEIIKTRGAISPKICTAIGILTARALAFAHEQEYTLYGKNYTGIVHRDLKPSNIMICNNGELKLMDFGVARPADASFHTIDGAVVGTIQYMSPELLRGENLDSRTDIYAFGATLYEILVGRNAFPESNFSKLVSLKQRNEFRTIGDYKINLPSKLRRLINRCMQDDKNKRYNNTQDILEELQQIHHSITNESPEDTIMEICCSKPVKKFLPEIGYVFPWKPVLRILLLLLFIVTTYVFVLPWGLEKYKGFISSLSQRERERIKKENKEEERIKKIILAKEQKLASAKSKQTIAKPPAKSKTPILKPVLSKAEHGVTNEKLSKNLSFFDIMSRKYDTDNVLEIVEKAYEAGDYKNALSLYSVKPQKLGSDRALMYKVRLLSNMNMKTQLKSFIQANSINDGEFFLEKAKIAISVGKIQTGEALLKKSLNAPKQFIDYISLKKEVHFQLAKCASIQFDRQSTKDNYLRALEEWRNLGALFSNNKSHSYFLKYRTETRRIGEKFQSLQN